MSKEKETKEAIAITPCLSVIVPVYNVEKYLPQCLESLIHQTLQDIEIILVNDGSTDQSEKICREYADGDSRIKLFTKPNGGLSDARNYGLERVSAEVVGFVDSDDYIDLDMFRYLYEQKQKTSSQIAVGGVKMVTNDGSVYQTRAVPQECVYDRHDTIAEVLYSKRVLNAVTNKIFDIGLFRGIRFPVGKVFEDAFIIYDLLQQTTSVAFTNQVFYYYRFNQQSISHKSFSVREFDRIEASLKKVDFVRKQYPDLLGLAEQYVVYDCMMTMSKMDHYDHRYDELVLNNIRKYWRSFLKGDHSLSSKLFVLSALVSPGFTVFVNRRLHG